MLKQLFVITLAANQTREIPFRPRLIMKSKLAAAYRAIQRRAIVLAHPYRQSCRMSRIRKLLQVVCSIGGVPHAKWTDEGKSVAHHVI